MKALRGLRDRERQLANELLDKGWKYRTLSNGHLRFMHPAGRDAVTFPRSPSDHRGWKNLRADIRRIERGVEYG